MKRTARQLGFYAALLAVWIIVARMRIWPPYVLPNPKGVWDSLVTGFSKWGLAPAM